MKRVYATKLPPDSVPASTAAQETGVRRKKERERREEARVRVANKRQFPGTGSAHPQRAPDKAAR